MIERRSGARLAQQALASFRGGSCSRQYFHGNFAVQFQIGRAINNAHAAAADFTIKPVALAEYRPGNDSAVDDFVATKDASVLRIVNHLITESFFRSSTDFSQWFRNRTQTKVYATNSDH